MIGLYWHFCETILFLLPESFLMLISVFEYSQRPLRAISKSRRTKTKWILMLTSFDISSFDISNIVIIFAQTIDAL